MKRGKKILAAVVATTALVLGATSFVACSNGDEESGSGSNAQQIITITTTSTSFSVGSEVEVKYETSANLEGLFGILCIKASDGSYVIKKTRFGSGAGTIKISATDSGNYSAVLYVFDEDVAPEADEEDYIEASEAALVTSAIRKAKYCSNEITVIVTQNQA